MSNLKVALLLPPPEPAAAADRADTFVQAAEIGACLDRLGHRATSVVFRPDRQATAAALGRLRPDVVVNLVEDLPEGPDQLHLATALLDRLGLRYTGTPTAGLAGLGDKRTVKARLRAARLPTPAGPEAGAGPFIVKSAIEHASIGLDATSVVADAAQAAALVAAREAQYGGPWFAERYIEGREFNVGLLGGAAEPRVLPVAEILFLAHAGRPRIVGYEEKWAASSAAYAATPRAFPRAPRDGPLLDRLAALSRAVWELFGLRGCARIDFRVAGDGAPYIVDINANPCLAREAGLCAAAGEIGLSQTDIVRILIEIALA